MGHSPEEKGLFSSIETLNRGQVAPTPVLYS